MSSTITYPYTTPGNYTYDTDKIEVTGGVAKLKLIDETGLTYTEDFANDTNFTYDSAKAEFSGGILQQKNQRPTDATFGAQLSTTATANWGDGTLAPNAFNGSISGGWAVLAAGKRLRYLNSSNMDSVDTGTMVFKIRFDYTGTPDTNQRIIEHCVSVIENRITIRHLASGGLLFVEFYGKNGFQQIATSTGFSPTSGNEYEFLISWDLSGVSDYTNIYINKTRNATLSTTGLPCARDNDVSARRTQFYAEGSGNVGFAVKDFMYFSTVQENGASYTTDYSSVPNADYLTSKVELPTMTYPDPTGIGTTQAFTNFTVTDNNAPHYVINDLYYSGGWTSSNGTYAQGNTEAEVLANIATLPLADVVNIDLLFNEGNVQMDADDLALTYTGQIYPTDNPTILTNSSFQASELLTFSETVTTPGSDEIKYTIAVSGTPKWSNSGTVETSNDTYAESNTDAEITTDIADFVTTRHSIKLKAFLHSEDGSTTPELDLNTFTYDAALVDPIRPTLVDLNGYVYDMNGPLSGETIKIRPYRAGYINISTAPGIFQKYEYETIATTDSDGYFSGNVYVQPTNEFLDIKIGKQAYKTSLPDQDAVDFSTLTLTLIED